MAKKPTYEELEQKIKELENEAFDRKRAEEVLRESKDNLDTAQKIAHVGSWSRDLKTNRGQWSDEMYRIVGLIPGIPERPPREIFLSRVHPNDRERIASTLKEAEKKGQPFEFEFRTIPIDGEERVIYERGEVECDDIGTPVRILGTTLDITKRKQAEEALRESEEKYRNIFNNAQVGIFRTRISDGKVLECNDRFARTYGYKTPEECIDDFVVSERYTDPVTREKMVATLKEKGKVNDMEARFSRKDGDDVWVRFSARAYPEEGYLEGVGYDITDYKQAQVELKESEDKFRNFAEQSLVGIYLISGDVFKYVNPKFAEIFGYSVDECLDNMHFRQLVHPEDLATVQKQVDRRLSGETKSVRYSFRGIKKSGETIHVEIFGSSMLLKGKRVATGTMLDITERKRAEASLQREKENLSTTLDNNPHGIVLFDNNGKWIYANPMFTEITGYTPEDIQTGREWFQKAYPDADYRKKVIGAWKNDSKQGGRGETYEFNVTCKDGQVKQIEFSATHLADRSVSVLTDVTQKKKIEKSLYEAKLFLDNISDLAYMADSEGNVIYANPAAEKITGLALSEIIDRPLLPLIVEKDHDFLIELYNRTLAGESLENIVTFNSGITCHFTSLPFMDNHGNIIGTFGIARDISDRLDAEEALKESEARLKKAQSVAKLGNWEYDISTRKIWGSEQAFRIYGIERTSPYLPFDRVEACIPDAPRVNQALVDLIQENKRYDIEFEVKQEISGETILIHSIAELVHENDIPVKVLGVIQDVTEQKKAEKERKDLEDQLQHAKKMEAIGTLAGGVAHDLNNILGGLVSYPELLLLQLPEDSPLKKSIVTIQKSGEKAAAVVQDLLTLARRGVVVTEVVNLNDLIAEYLKSPEHENLQSYHPGVYLETHLATDTLNILGSSTHLSKTVMNLISNAAEAMPVGGKIIITTENRYIDRPIRGYDNVKEGDYVVLTVSDTGTGISPDDMEKIFEPFYTKKKMGRSGTGLGMAVVWGTIKDHNGYIDVKSKEGRGTTFTVYFPVTRKSIEERSKISLEDYMGKGEAILVVDDVEGQRKIASGMLKELGYSVVSVSSGDEAVEYLKTNEVDLLVLDMIMDPGMDGLETYRKIIEIHPGQKAIIASGFSETDRVKKVQSLGAGAYLRKPFLLEKIGIAVKEELKK